MPELPISSWRGKLISTRKDSSGKKYMVMSGTKSILYISLKSVEPNKTYRVTIDLKSDGGNGEGYCNIYGNRKFDFPHVRFKCEKGGWQTYDINIKTGNFPNTVPLVFRIWRPENSSGKLLVRRIIFTSIGDPKKEQKGPELISQQTRNNALNINDSSQNNPIPPKVLPGRVPNVFKSKPIKPISTEERRSRRRRMAIERAQRRGDFSVESTHKLFPQPPPRILPQIIEPHGIKVSVIISIFNRIEFFERALYTYAKQTIGVDNFEIVVVDDKSSDDINGLCKRFAKEYGVKFQYILINKYKGAIEPRGFTPALSNNIGLKHARGSVIVITGPETLQKETNLERSWETANNGACVYGNVYRSNLKFVNVIKKTGVAEKSFSEIIKIRGSKADVSVTKGFWWYYIAVRKEHLMSINGVDERFMRGISGEDDDLARRMKRSGVPLVREPSIEGIHQDHSAEDKKDLHAFRFNSKQWNKLRRINEKLLNSWNRTKNTVANTNIDWGSSEAIIKKENF